MNELNATSMHNSKYQLEREALPQDVCASWEAWRDSDDRPYPHYVQDAYLAGWLAAKADSK